MATYWLKIAYLGYSYPSLIRSAPPLPMFPFEFRDEVNYKETSHEATLW